MQEELVELIVEMKEQEALDKVKELIASQMDPLEILDACSQAMEQVGNRFENGEYFLPELIMAGELLKQISEIIKPTLKGVETTKKLDRVLIGTVAGDIHNIGKDIVTFILEVNGFDVRDLGVDISSTQFVEAIKDFQPQVVGMSGLLTVAYDSIKQTVQAIEDAGMRNDVKIMIGGGLMSEKVKEYTGADAYGENAVEAVRIVKDWTGAE